MSLKDRHKQKAISGNKDYQKYLDMPKDQQFRKNLLRQRKKKQAESRFA